MAAMSSLASLGSAIFKVVGLNPQRLSTMSESRVPGRPVWGGMDYQTTGLGEAHTRFEAVTYPHVIGGLDALAWLQQYHEQQKAVNYIRLSSTVTYLGRMLGRVIIRNIFVEETMLHPIDGVGRKVGVELDLVYVSAYPDAGAPSNLLT